MEEILAGLLVYISLMEYQIVKFKQIHFDGLENVNLKDEFESRIYCAPAGYDFENGFPISFTWKHRVFKGEDIALSYIAEDKYIIYFKNKEERPIAELKKLIDFSHMRFCFEWRTLVFDSLIKEWQVPSLPLHDKISIASDLILSAQSNGSLV
jgi:hypothetical protein